LLQLCKRVEAKLQHARRPCGDQDRTGKTGI
jgi:hypothetical protein